MKVRRCQGGRRIPERQSHADRRARPTLSMVPPPSDDRRAGAPMFRSTLFLAAACVAALAGPAVLVAGSAGQAPPSLAPYLPTPQEVVDRMLQMAAVTKTDVVYDLGSGDGRLVITAA